MHSLMFSYWFSWLVLTSLRASSSASFQCRNPLFKGHWSAADSVSARLESAPLPHTDLRLCRMWNSHNSCCNVFMEAPQQRAFDSRHTQLVEKVALLSGYLKALMEVRSSDVYQQEAAMERALFDRALNSFKPTLDAAATCVRAITVFVAGMACFSCNPNWDQFVWRGMNGDVTAVNVAGESCIYVADRCGPLGRAMRLTVLLVMESTLAKQPPLPLPDLSMLEDREKMCDWLRTTIAMQPLRSVELHVAGNAADLQSRKLVSEASRFESGTLLGHAPRSLALTKTPNSRPYPSRPRATLDPVRDGQQSGFYFGDKARMLLGEKTLDGATDMDNAESSGLLV